MTPKKLVSSIVIISALLFVILLIQAFRGNSSHTSLPIISGQTSPTETEDQIEADLYSAQDNARWQTYKLTILRSGTSPDPQKIAQQQQDVVQSQTALTKAEVDAYSNSADVVSKTNIALADDQINALHDDMNSILATWKQEIDSENPPTPEVINGYLASLQTDLNDSSEIAQSLTPDSSGISQIEINSYQAALQDALDEIQSTITELTQAETDEERAEEELVVVQSVGDQSAIDNQTNVVLGAESQVSNLEDELGTTTSPTVIPVTPFTGTSTSPATNYYQQGVPYNYGYGPDVKFVPLPDPNQPHLIQTTT